MAQTHSKNIGTGHSRVETITIPKDIQSALDAIPLKKRRNWLAWEDEALLKYSGERSLQAIARVLGRTYAVCWLRLDDLKKANTLVTEK